MGKKPQVFIPVNPTRVCLRYNEQAEVWDLVLLVSDEPHITLATFYSSGTPDTPGYLASWALDHVKLTSKA